MANLSIDGGTVLMYVDDVALAYSTSCNASLSNALREAPHKADGGWGEKAGGRKSVTGSCNFWIAFTDAEGAALFNLAQLWPIVDEAQDVVLSLSNGEVDDYEWSGPAKIETLNMSFGNLGETAEGDFSFQSSGAWSQSVITA